MSYFEANGTPVLDFWRRLLWVSKPEWATLFALRRRTYIWRNVDIREQYANSSNLFKRYLNFYTLLLTEFRHTMHIT